MNRAFALIVVAATIVLLGVDLRFREFFGPFIVLPIALLPFVIMGTLLILRVPGNIVGWLLGAAGLIFELVFASGAYGYVALSDEAAGLPGGWAAALVTFAGYAPAIACVVLVLFHFPSGRGLGGWWTWAERGLVAVIVIGTIANVFKDAPLDIPAPLALGSASVGVVPNPLVVHGPLGALVGLAGHLLTESPVILLTLVGPLSLLVRYRRSAAIERQQMKWLGLSGAIAFVLLVSANFAQGIMSDALWITSVVALGFVPVSVALAIFRYRLYDIDVLIRRTLVYAAVSAVLVAVYVGGVGLFESLLAPFTTGNGISVAISTLAVVALFQPVRRRVQGAVDRRFYRARYDAVRTLDEFSVRLRDQVDLEAVRADLLAAVRETVRPVHVELWLKDHSS
jgi:hypothetical protein